MHCVDERDGINEEDGGRRGETPRVENPELNNHMSQREEKSADVKPLLAFEKVPVGAHAECVDAMQEGASPAASFLGNTATSGVRNNAADGVKGENRRCQEHQVQLAWGGDSCTTPKNVGHVMLPTEETEVENFQASGNLANSSVYESSIVGGDDAGVSLSWASRQRRPQNGAERWRKQETETWRRSNEQCASLGSPTAIVKRLSETNGSTLQIYGDGAYENHSGGGGVIIDAGDCDDALETRCRRYSSIATRRLCRHNVEFRKSDDDGTVMPLWQTFAGSENL
ncbi:hypothetical protein TraAM80_05114 [Trypanosoma rangeli]|uniref:Uncharacterized protein n=1 Tax=Trypanosoma rangeli TaxID=5698 RepID=A0A3R7NLR1_TRYRA|nr:uncharacterized protein TraAM80_05114 [Trypanosoma rangeli]RNF04522.1 hypothetical protein TraAM80_05114 [Trypanosoma rangeli]|eukprot:RNF04522.1 hypothetical protein TraAM80_05114 [Trypanosoma rangeli]